MPTKKPSAKQLAARAKFVKMVRAKAAKSKAAKKKGVKKKLGALPIGFSGKIYDISFKIINQYDIYGDVSAIMEDSNNGSIIVVFNGKGTPKDKAEAILNYINKNTNFEGGNKDNKSLYSRMLKFATNMQKEVKDFNAGKKKTIKKSPLVILKPKKVAKKAALKKATTKKTTKNKTIKQTGYSNIAYDKRLQANKPGKRISKKGNVYYENRENRSDKGKLLGIGEVNLVVLRDYEIVLKKIGIVENSILTNKTMTKYNKYTGEKLLQAKRAITNYKKYLSELKSQKSELKKLL